MTYNYLEILFSFASRVRHYRSGAMLAAKRDVQKLK